ncbi:MAG: hypothetical protein Q4B05_00810 [Candidatus Saccharibacteria bacterium]|nr:hypothetical protein [Candidatus Saccharibacteria bacterium]
MSKSQQPIQDERVAMEEKKYRSEALLLIEIVLVLSIVTKEYILQLPPESTVTDWILLILAAAYPFVRGLLAGGGAATQHTPQRRSKVILGLVTASAVPAAIVMLLNYQRYGNSGRGLFDPYLLAVFGIVFLAMMICNTAIYGLAQLGSRRAQKRIDKELGRE